MKILILALSGIGDALMFSPSVKLLKNSLPEAQIDMLVMFKGALDIYKHNPHLSNLIHFDFLKEGKLNSLIFVLSLRKKYDLTINVYPSNRKEYNIISFLIGSKKKIAVKYKSMFYQNLGFLNNYLIYENDESHNVETNAKMVEKLLNISTDDIPSMEIFFNDEDEKFAADYIKNLQISENDLVIGIHPGCATLKNHIKRRWEPEKFIGLSKKLLNEYNCKILLFGGPEESDLKSEIKNGVNSEFIYEVKTDTLLQSSAIMKRSNYFITNDSALMHVASALQLNVVALIGPTNSFYIHPWKTNHKIISLNLECSPCFFYSPKPLSCKRTDVQFKCIKELTVDYVFESIKNFISETQRN